MTKPQSFTKKPVTIEAMQWDGTAAGATPIIDWVLSKGGTAVYDDYTGDAPVLVIRTLEGDMEGRIGWWIIQGVEGEFYPCKPEIFDATYEPAKKRADKAEVYRDKAGEYRYRIIAGNGEIVDASTQGYANRFSATRGARRGRRGVKIVQIRR